MFETVVGWFIITNTTLQLAWFVWSYRNHHRKHYTDDTVDSQEIELYDRVKEYYDIHYQNEKETKTRNEMWSDFTTPATSPEFEKFTSHLQDAEQIKSWKDDLPRPSEMNPPTKFDDGTWANLPRNKSVISTPKDPKRGKDGKYNPKDINGFADDFFNIDQG